MESSKETSRRKVMLEPNLKRSWLYIGKRDRSSDKKGFVQKILECLIWVVAMQECSL